MSPPAATTLTLQVTGDLEEIARVNESVEQFWQRHNLREDAGLDVLLCVEEVLSNVIRHGRADAARRGIQVDTRLTRDEVEIRISDDGVAFDPLSYPPPRVDLPLEHRRPGGLGVHLVRNLMDRIHYERCGARNVFTMARRLTRANRGSDPTGAV